MTLSRLLILFFLLLMFSPSGVKAADFVVVVNNENSVESMDRVQVQKIFLGKKTYWSQGQNIDVLLMTHGDVHRSFVLEILHKSPQQLLMYWKQILFSGTGIPPRQHPDSDSVKKAVAANPRAIGYIDAQQLDDTVKKINLN